MTKKRITKKVTRKKSPLVALSTGLLPEPPPGEERVALHIDIPGKVNWRIKLALLVSEGEGTKVSKKHFVEEALIRALDHFDKERAG